MKPPAARPPRSLLQQAQLANSRAQGSTAGEAQPQPSHMPVEAGSWADFFAEAQDLSLPERQGTFRVYRAGTQGPLLFMLHGGGYTGMTWAACLQHLDLTKYQVAALDMRGHGSTSCADEADLSLHTLAEDAVAVLAAVASSEAVPTVLIGHSMGGAVAVQAAASGKVPGLAGLVVIDVVEGTALQALPVMPQILARRPASFSSLQAAMAWAVDTGMCKQLAVAAISLPSQLREASKPEAHTLAAAQRPEASAAQAAEPGAAGLGQIAEASEPTSLGLGQIAEDKPDTASLPDRAAPSSNGAASSQHPRQTRWVWRTDLAASEPFWQGWYQGMSAAFLAVKQPKLLVLADTNRLDTTLTVAQMQGKFQMQIVPEAGHAVHEDNAELVGSHLAAFLKRQRVGEPPLHFPKLFNK